MISFEYDPNDDASFTLPFAAGIVYNVGDLLWWDATNKVVKPAAFFPDTGAENTLQAAFALLFVGWSGEKRRATDEARDGIVIRKGFMKADVVSGTYHFGAALAPVRDGVATALMNSTLKLTTVSGATSGVAFCVGEYPAGTTSVIAQALVDLKRFTP